MYAIVYNYMLSGDTIFIVDNSDSYFKAIQSNVQCQWFFRTFSRNPLFFNGSTTRGFLYSTLWQFNIAIENGQL